MANQVAKSYDGILRKKKNPFRKGSNRRVSCKDLGNGDCEGWLWKKSEKPGFASRDWRKFWFTLKEKSLYYYKHKEDDTAQGIFMMPAFKVSPAGDKESTRKFAFKAWHPRHGTFLFASERKEDMVKWMNMIQIACLPDVNPRQLCTISSVTEDYSGSESDDDSSLRSQNGDSISQEFPVHDNASIDDRETSSTPEGYEMPETQLSQQLTSQHLSLLSERSDGSCELSSSARSSTLIEKTLRSDARTVFERSIKRKSKASGLKQHLASLRRTLKDKENELSNLENFLDKSSEITSDALHEFLGSSRMFEIERDSDDGDTESCGSTNL